MTVAMKKLGFVLAIVFAFSFVMQSCQKEETDPYAGKEAPKLPSEKTFVMPFDNAMHDEFGGSSEDRTIANWGHAAGNVLVWNTVLTANLAIPVLAFHAAINHEPLYQGSGIWLWEYSVSDASGTYHAKLYGELLVSEEVKWDMYISKTGSGAFSEVHWYTGITAWDESYAHWTLNHNPYSPTPFIQIDYQKDNGAGVASIRYTNIIPGDAGNGSYIEYREGFEPSGEFDRAYDVFAANVPNLLEILWNSADKHGRVKDPVKFGDQEWHCWDTNLQDVQCF